MDIFFFSLCIIVPLSSASSLDLQPPTPHLLLRRNANRPQTELLSLDILETAIRIQPTRSDTKLATYSVVFSFFLPSIVFLRRDIQQVAAQQLRHTFFWVSFLFKTWKQILLSVEESNSICKRCYRCQLSREQNQG